mmetsp:Transcript_759/g.1373  ORF Transcript_759/g.1373 Transcript_759/m.1373 type:complete len:291 (-) Transcript_759:338-1210(-)
MGRRHVSVLRVPLLLSLCKNFHLHMLLVCRGGQHPQPAHDMLLALRCRGPPTHSLSGAPGMGGARRVVRGVVFSSGQAREGGLRRHLLRPRLAQRQPGVVHPETRLFQLLRLLVYGSRPPPRRLGWRVLLWRLRQLHVGEQGFESLLVSLYALEAQALKVRQRHLLLHGPWRRACALEQRVALPLSLLQRIVIVIHIIVVVVPKFAPPCAVWVLHLAGVLGAASTRALLLGLVESPGRILRLPPPQMLKLDEVAPLVLQLNARAPLENSKVRIVPHALPCANSMFLNGVS